MPELPEVETIVRDLKRTILGRKIEDVWSDFQKTVKKPKSFKKFKKDLKGRQIQNIKRRGKNILIELSGEKTLLIHQKMTGHLLLGKWKRKNNKWQASVKGPILEDPMNRFLHLIFWLNDGKMLALSDLRKFAKVELWESKELEESKIMKELGPEPLEKVFTFSKFKEGLKNKKAASGPLRGRSEASEPLASSPSRSGRQRRGKIKQVLMDQTVIVGVGNIYSDEILWKAKINPFRSIQSLKEGELKKIYHHLKEVLFLAIKLKGTSISDFRQLSGEKGYYSKIRKAYRKTGEKCSRCDKIIKRAKLGGRSAHFCSNCQK